MAPLISASLQAPTPVSWSGVMFDAVASKAGVLKTRPPDNSFSNIGSPLAVFGVWQLPQANIELTRYCPRSVGVCAKAAVVAASKPANPNVPRRNICPSIASMAVKTRMDVSVPRPIVIGAKRYCCRECDDAGAQRYDDPRPRC